jgi:anaerobic magnesium-protoporphyrin IX monomethyl ester cyclase
VAISWPWVKKQANHRILWLDLGDLGDLVHPSGPHEQWQDHGLGLLRTIMHQAGIMTDLASTRAVTKWEQLARQMQGYEMLLMNVRSYTYPVGLKAAQLFKQVNPNGIVLAGGMHATVAPDEMLAIDAFDHVVQGPGEKTIVDLVQDPSAFRAWCRAWAPSVDGRVADDRPRAVAQTGGLAMQRRWKWKWPLEPECGWGPARWRR